MLAPSSFPPTAADTEREPEQPVGGDGAAPVDNGENFEGDDADDRRGEGRGDGRGATSASG